MEKEKKQAKFDIQQVISHLESLVKGYQENKDIAFDEFCQVLKQFCMLFKEVSTFLGIAFSDVTEKREVFQNNRKIYPEPKGFFEFVRMEMGKNIHVYNGNNNSDLNAPKQFQKYNSTSRNLLRMMWFLTFVRVTFQQSKHDMQSMSDILDNAYDTAFGEKHSWLVRKGAKIAIMTSGNRTQLIEIIIGGKYDQQKFLEIDQRFLAVLIPIHETLWAFYRQHNLVDLK